MFFTFLPQPKHNMQGSSVLPVFMGRVTKRIQRTYFKRYYAKHKDDILKYSKGKSTPMSKKATNKASYAKKSTSQGP